MRVTIATPTHAKMFIFVPFLGELISQPANNIHRRFPLSKFPKKNGHFLRKMAVMILCKVSVIRSLLRIPYSMASVASDSSFLINSSRNTKNTTASRSAAMAIDQ